MSSLTSGVAGEAPKQCFDPVTSVGKCEGLQPCHLFSKNSGIPSFTSSSSPAPCPPYPRFAFGALPSAPPLLPCIGGCQGFQNISKEASGKGLACKNRSRVVLSSPHYWTGKSCTVTARLAKQKLEWKLVLLAFQQFNCITTFGNQAVVRTISNPHHDVVRTISNPHHNVVRTISNPHHIVVRIRPSSIVKAMVKIVK